MRKSDLEEQIESLQDVLTDIREMIYGALEPTDDEPETQVESLRNVLPSYSREVLNAGPSVSALRDAAERAVDDCRAALG